MNKYQRKVQDIVIDIYDILAAYNVTDQAVGHAIKKLLMPGQRGHKTALQDLMEAKASIERAITIMEAQK